MKKGSKKFVKNFKEVIKRPEMSILPGQLAFYFLMSLIPIIALATLIVSKITTSFNLFDIISSVLPSSLTKIFESVVNSANSYNNFFVLLFFYIFLGSNGPGAIIIASNTLYGIKSKGYIDNKIKAMFMTIVMIILLIFLLLIPIGGDFLIGLLTEHFTSLKSIYNHIYVYEISKALMSFFVIFVNVKLLYTMAPNKKIKSKHTTIGTLFTSSSWVIASEIFLFYITNIATYDALYGNFANILVLLLWIYLLAYLFVIGMAININWYQIDDTNKDKKVKNEESIVK